MYYETNQYIGGGTAIEAYTEEGEPFAECSVCLASYGFVPAENQIVVPVYKMSESTAERIVDDLAKKVIGEVKFGPFDATGLLIELEEEYWPEDFREQHDQMLVDSMVEMLDNGMTEEEIDEYLIIEKVM